VDVHVARVENLRCLDAIVTGEVLNSIKDTLDLCVAPSDGQSSKANSTFSRVTTISGNHVKYDERGCKEWVNMSIVTEHHFELWVQSVKKDNWRVCQMQFSAVITDSGQIARQWAATHRTVISGIAPAKGCWFSTGKHMGIRN
jgi:hypothetical protein